MNMVFIPWFMFNWEFQAVSPVTEKLVNTSIAESFWIDHESDLTEAEITFLDSAIAAPYSLCEILDVKPTISLKLRDLLTRNEYEVVECMASKILNSGQIIYCTTIEIGNTRSILATAPLPLHPTDKRDILKLRELIVEAVANDNLTEMELMEFETEIRILYLNLAAQMFAPPELVNTDKEPFLPQKVHFDLRSVAEGYEALKNLAGEDNERTITFTDMWEEAVSEPTPARARAAFSGSDIVGGGPGSSSTSSLVASLTRLRLPPI